MKQVWILAVVVAMLPSCVAVSNVESAPAAASSADGIVAMAPEDIVAARRTTYFLSTQAVGQIKAGFEEGGDLNRSRAGAMMLARWADTLPTMFPEGTNIDGSRALDTVWTDREGFLARAAAYRDAAREVARVAETGDREATNSAFMAMAGTCHACHQSYREE